MLGYKDIPSASNGLEGFEMAEKTRYDLILMDIQMPVMDGYTSLKRIMSSPLTGQPCVVALTANADMVSQTQHCQDLANQAGYSRQMRESRIFYLPLQTAQYHQVRNNPYFRSSIPSSQ